MVLSNNPVPAYYMSDMQFSRLYALVYLDEQLRANPEYGVMYRDYMEDKLTEASSWDEATLLSMLVKAVGGEQAFGEFKGRIPDAATFFERYVRHARGLVPAQTVKEAVEINQFWAATNSIIYILTIHQFAAYYKDKHDVPLFKNSVHGQDTSAELTRTIILNMMFLKPVQIDPVPSVLDGYSFDTLEDIINNKDNRAITLPSNATCC